MNKAKLFLSYGRRDAEEVALRLKKDLELADYEVWMDHSEIKAGTAWMNEIEKALRSSQAMLALLSPHAVRMAGVDGCEDDSVCLDEIAFAREYPGKILPIMVADCQIPFLLCRLHYIDLRSWQTCENEYQQGLKSVIQGIEAALRNEVLYRSWQTHLQPWDFTPFIEERRRGFIGRHWLFEEVQAWLKDKPEESCLLIKGDPGIGKSAFVGQWVHLNPGGRLLAYHCCQLDSPTTLQPYCFIRSIAAMIASQIPAYEAKLHEPSVADALKEAACREDPFRGFDAGILSPLHRIEQPGEGIRLILIDALDEAILLKDDRTIVDVIENRLGRLPSWLRIVATTRKEPAVLKKLERLRAASLDTEDPRNQKDARAFLESKFREPFFSTLLQEVGMELTAAVEFLQQQSKGNFLYIHYALEGLMIGNYHLDRPQDFPPGLPGFYEKAFQHRFVSEQEYSPAASVLAAVLAAREPLDAGLLLSASGLSSNRDFNRILKKLAVYLPDRNGTYSLFHRSLAEWLQDSKNNEDFCVEVSQGERNLAEAGWSDYQQKAAGFSPYMLRNLPHHLFATGQKDRLVTLLTDFTILNAAWESGREHEWMRYWRQMMDKVDMVAAYQKSIDQLLTSGANEPELAAFTRKVGGLLRALGLYDQALPFAEKAVTLSKMNNTGDDAELASSLLDLAETCRHLRQFEKAQSFYEYALRIREQRFGRESAEAGEVVYALSVYHNTCANRNVDKSIEFNERAISIRDKLDPPDYAALADAINDKGVLLSAKGEKDKTLPYYEKAKELFEKGFPDGHPELGVVLCNISDFYFHQGALQKAVDMKLRGLQMRSLFVVPYDFQCQRFRRDLVNYYLYTGQPKESLKWALDVLVCAASDPHYSKMDKLDDLSNLAISASVAGDLKERGNAIDLLVKEAKSARRDEFEAAWQRITDLYIALINLELQRQNGELASSLFAQIRDIMISEDLQPVGALAFLHREMAAIMDLLEYNDIRDALAEQASKYDFLAEHRMPLLLKLAKSNELMSQNDFIEARRLADEAFSFLKMDTSSEEDWKRYIGGVANEMALRAKNEKNEFELAEWFYQQSISIDPSSSTAIANYAFLLTSVYGRHDEAVNLYEKALEINPTEANTLSNFAVFYTHIRRNFEKAEELFARAHAMQSEHTNAVAANYAVLSIIRGDFDNAHRLIVESREACLKQPDRLIARPLFCATAIAAMCQQDWTLYLAQIKSLFLMGVDRAPWQAHALIDFLHEGLPETKYAFLNAVWQAICSKTAEAELEKFPEWGEIRPMPLDKPWPV